MEVVEQTVLAESAQTKTTPAGTETEGADQRGSKHPIESEQQAKQTVDKRKQASLALDLTVLFLI